MSASGGFKSLYLTMSYNKNAQWTLRPNKPKQSQYKANTNPIQTQYKPNTNPIQTQNKPKFLINDFLGIFYLASAVFYLKYLVEANAKGRWRRTADNSVFSIKGEILEWVAGEANLYFC